MQILYKNVRNVRFGLIMKTSIVPGGLPEVGKDSTFDSCMRITLLAGKKLGTVCWIYSVVWSHVQ